METENRAVQLANWIVDKGVGGFGPMSSAEALAQEYLGDDGYTDNEERVRSLIRWESSKNVATGFATGVGGFATLPVAIPAGFGAAWLVQARLAAAVARIHGHNLNEDRVRTLVLMSVLGDVSLKQPIRAAGVTITQSLLRNGIKAVPASVLRRINRTVGMPLLTKTGKTSVLNLTKLVPGLSGVVGGAIDGLSTYGVGVAAQKIFAPPPAAKKRAAKRVGASRPAASSRKSTPSGRARTPKRIDGPAPKTAKVAVRRRTTGSALDVDSAAAG